MKHRMFCVHDVKANAFMQPWFLFQDGMALRAFSDCVNDPEHNFGRHPADFTLFYIGVFEDDSGMVVPCTPVSLGNGIAFLKLHTAEEPDDLFAGDGKGEKEHETA